MKMKLIAIGVIAATFAPTVLAQSANPVTLYGRLWVMVNSVKADGGAGPLSTRTTVNDASSLIGFRGSEDLGGGVKAFFQLESAATPDVGGGTFGSRNSGVGISGNFGSVVLGRWDTPLKVAALFMDPTGQNTIANQQSIINTGNFSRRENNTVQYWSPTFNGFSGRFMYGANEARTATTNPSLIGLSGDYDIGYLRANYSYEKHKDQRGATIVAGVSENANTLSATLTLGPVKFGLLTQVVKSTGLTDRKATLGAATYTTGNNEVFISIGQSKNGVVSTAAQPKSNFAALGYNYNFSKRTTFMARYASLKNNSAANLPLSGSDLPAFALDNDPKGFGTGLRHTF